MPAVPSGVDEPLLGDRSRQRPSHTRVRSFGSATTATGPAAAGGDSFATSSAGSAMRTDDPRLPVRLASLALRPRDISAKFLRQYGSDDFDWSLVSAVSTAPFNERIGLSDANLFHCMLTVARPPANAAGSSDSAGCFERQHSRVSSSTPTSPTGNGLQHVRTFDSVLSVGSGTQPPHSPIGVLARGGQPPVASSGGHRRPSEMDLGVPSTTPTSGDRTPAAEASGTRRGGGSDSQQQHAGSSDSMSHGSSYGSSHQPPNALSAPRRAETAEDLYDEDVTVNAAQSSNQRRHASGLVGSSSSPAAAGNHHHQLGASASSSSKRGNGNGGGIVQFLRRVKNVAVAEVGPSYDDGGGEGAVPPSVIVIKHYDTAVVDSPSMMIRWFRHVTRNTAEDWYRNELLFYVAVRPILNQLPGGDLAFRCPQVFFAARLDRGSRPGFLRYVCCRHGSGSLATIGIEDLTRAGYTFAHGNRQGFADVNVTLACAYALADLHSVMWGRPDSDERFRTVGPASILAGVHRVGMSIGAKMDLAKVSLRSLVDEWQDYTPLFTLDAVIRAMADTQRRWSDIRARSSDRIKARTTLVHGDFHFKNIGLRRRLGGGGGDGKPDTDVCAVDFQNFGAGSPVAELLYFMCTSLPVEVLAAPRYTHASVALLDDVDDDADDSDGGNSGHRNSGNNGEGGGGSGSGNSSAFRTVLTTDSFGANPLTHSNSARNSTSTATGRLSSNDKTGSTNSVDRSGGAGADTSPPRSLTPAAAAEARSTARRVAAASLNGGGDRAATPQNPVGWEPPRGTEQAFLTSQTPDLTADSHAAATLPPPLMGGSFDPHGSTSQLPEAATAASTNTSFASPNTADLPPPQPAVFTGTSRVRVPKMRCEADYISFMTLDDVLAFDEAILRAYFNRLSARAKTEGYGDSFATFHAVYYELARHWAGAVLCDMATSSVSERQTLKRRSPEQLQKLIDWGEKTSARVLLTVAAHQASLEAPSAPPLREMERPPPSGFGTFANSDLIHRIFGGHGGSRSRRSSQSPAADHHPLGAPTPQPARSRASSRLNRSPEPAFDSSPLAPLRSSAET